MEMFDHVASHLIANPRASTVMQADLEARQIDVSGCPGWPSPIIPRDLYRIGSLVEKIPELREVRDQYKALFDEEESSGVLSRGTVFMIIDMILNSAPARNAAYYINGPDMEIVIHDPVDRLPKDLTMARLESMIDKAA